MATFKEQWQRLSIKTKIAYITAVIAFTIGWGLAIAGFVLGGGIVSDSVLWILGQALVYAASVFGVGMYVGASVKNMKKAIGRFMAKEMKAQEISPEDLEEEFEEEEV